jgi:hypothetical protein
VRVVFATVVCAIAIGSFAADLWFLDYFGPSIVIGLPWLSFALVGSLLVVRRAGDPIGWLLGAAGALSQLGVLSGPYAYGSGSLEAGAALPGAELALWLGYPIWIAVIGLIVSALVRFPDGSPPGRPFAILLWGFVAFVVIAAVGSALADRPIDVPQPVAQAEGPPRSVPNPFALHGPVGDLMLLAASAINIVAPLTLIAPLALVVRFRRSHGVERQQLKWLTYTAAIAFGLALIAFVAPPGPIRVLADPTSIFGIGLLPVAVGVAIFRYRLYDIDVLIRRTIIYAALSAILIAAYLVGLALFQAILAPITSGSAVAVAISTLAVVALFQPMRTRIQAAVDRRFYRSRYDAERTLDAFSVRLRAEVDLDAVRADLIDAVERTVQPAHATVWLRGQP